ncbi:MAG: hypothetical protein LBR55_03075, partial [Bacteroidales bacterium]|nr:hypothetical protein [Bacteroidales bacterium]
MKSFLRSTIFAIGAILLFNIGLFAQKDLVISGGNSVSSYICGNNKVVVWGDNSGGRLGVSGNPVTSPTAMPTTSFGGKSIRQVNSGSGGHFVALECGTGNVWGWGDNSQGQTGKGSTSAVETVPVQVCASAEIRAANVSAGKLTRATVVYAGNTSSFAILDDGRLVAWGGNTATGGNDYEQSQGQLGNGNMVDQPCAVYVRTANNQPIENVVQIFAGDNSAYCLTADGTVYSWGSGREGRLGRNAAGTMNSSANQDDYRFNDPWARPVLMSDGVPMTGMVQIACTDAYGMALDANGHVWTWGNPWQGLGQLTDFGGTIAKPSRVLAGNTTGASNDGDFLLARQIGGGQYFGLAVTVDGKPVIWGGNDCANGGGTSIAGHTAKGLATYIQNDAGTAIHNDVVFINRGDFWGFYGTSAGEIWAFGCNPNGVLGIGNTTNKPKASRMDNQLPPGANCGIADFKPEADITPKSFEVCKTEFVNQKLTSGFMLTGTKLANYQITWYKDDVQVAQSIATGTAAQITASVNTNKTYTATTEGEYRVEVKYIGNNSGCEPYEDAVDSMEIKFFLQEFKDPGGLEYDCNTNEAIVCVAPNDALTPPATAADIAKRVYKWYATDVSTAVLGTTIGSCTAPNGKATIDVSSIPANPGTPLTKTVWVEEDAGLAGTFMKRSNAACQTTSGEFNLSNGTINATASKAYAGFTVYETVTLTEASLILMTSQQPGNTGTANITLGIYKAGVNNGGPVPAGAPVGTLVASYTRTRGAAEAQDLTVVIQATGNVTLAPGEYFIGPSAYSSTGTISNPKIWGTSCAGVRTGADDITGNMLKQNLGMAAYNNPNQSGEYPMAFDIKFQTPQQFCDRIPVVLTEVCPCDKTTPTITISAPVAADDELCSGDAALTLKANATKSLATDKTDVTLFMWQWFKNGTAVGPAFSVANAADPKLTISAVWNSTATTADVIDEYEIRAYDKVVGTTCASPVATFEVISHPIPESVISGGGEYCEGDLISDVIVTFSGGVTP